MSEPTDADLIRFTLRFYRQAGAKDRAIRDEFGLSNTRFWAAVVRLCQDPGRVEALPPELQAQTKRLQDRFAA